MNNNAPEVEAKILGVSEVALIAKLIKLGFKHHFDGELKAQWLVNPLGNERIRVRKEGEIVMIEHKAPAPGAQEGIKSMQETGFEARDFDRVIATFKKIGLEEVGLPSVKHRVSYILHPDTEKQVRLDFDTYSELMGKPIPEFLEIESNSADRVYDIALALGFQKSDCRNFGAKQLFEHYYPNETAL